MRFRHSRAALVGTLAIASLTLVGAGRAPAAPPAVERIGVPNHATLTIHGRGYGHGHGLSQWGAQGAAEKGLSAKQIVRFYYPHTKAGRATGKVRVLISGDTDDNTTVVNQAGLEVHDLAGGATRTLPTKGAAGHASQWRMSAGKAGTTKVSYRNAGWHVWRKLTGDAEFRAGKPITLVLKSGKVTYRGRLQSRTPPGAAARDRVTVNKVSLEAYVQGVIPREAYPTWRQAALRAQAIAARSYAAFEEADSDNPVYQLCDTTSCQVYGGKSAEVASTNKAAAATKGQIRTYHGKPAFTQFSASNGGRLAKGSEPYLVAKRDPYDGFKGNPVHTWTTQVSAKAIEKAFGLGNLKSISITSRDGKGQWNGRIEDMKLVGSKTTVTPTGDDFRAALGLRSTWLDITVCSTCSRSMRSLGGR
jgi:SpoIID/LytB domain protein